MRKAPGMPRLCASFALLLALSAVFLHVQSVNCQCKNISFTPTPVVAPNIVLPSPDGTASFLFFATLVTWCTAEASCKDHGGHLASVHTSDENTLVLGTCFNKLFNDPQAGCWIGLNDIAVEGTYTWTDGSTVYYTDWYSGPGFKQPDDALQPDDEDCVFAFKAYAGWHDRICNATYGYVCRIPNNAQPSASVNASVSPSTSKASNLATTTPATPPTPPPPPSGGTDWRTIVATVAPILTGVAALVAISYTGWKWWHKRQATLAKKQVPAVAAKHHWWENGVQKRAGVKPVNVV